MTTDTDLVLCTSPDGWSLHAPGSTDEDIRTGEAPYLVSGTGRPTSADYGRAQAELERRMQAKLTAETVTALAIRVLRNEAESAGDERQVDLCDLALVGTDDAPTTEARTRRFLRAWRSMAEGDLATTIDTAMGARAHDDIMGAISRLGHAERERETAVLQARKLCADAINRARAPESEEDRAFDRRQERNVQ